MTESKTRLSPLPFCNRGVRVCIAFVCVHMPTSIGVCRRHWAIGPFGLNVFRICNC